MQVKFRLKVVLEFWDREILADMEYGLDLFGFGFIFILQVFAKSNLHISIRQT